MKKRKRPTQIPASALVGGEIHLRPGRLERAEPWIPKNWTFESRAVASRFDSHVREQLPFYDLVLDAIVHFGAHYIPRGGLVYDVGASTGNVYRGLAPYLNDRAARYVAIEKSAEMIAEWPPRVAGTELIEADAIAFDYEEFDFAVLNLVLMFLPVGRRAGFVRDLADKLRPGGAMVVVDKIVSPPGYVGQVLRRLAMKGKLEAGASAAEIVAKELSLGGVQRPIVPSVIPVGATRFFQLGEFVGWILEREETGLEPNHNFL